MKELTRKVAQLKEIDLAYDLLKKAAERLRLTGVDQWRYWMDPPNYKVEWLERGFANKEYFWVYQDTSLIGMYRLSSQDLDYWGPQDTEARYIHSLVIAPWLSGQGLGRMILREVQEDMLLQGIKTLRLDCHAGNARLCQYYEALGFIKVGQKQMPHSLNNLYQKLLF